MANFVVYADDIKGKHISFREDSIKFDRLICDIPSFAGRWPGTESAGQMIDAVNSVIDLIKNCVTKTATVSVTGDAQVKFDEWLASQSDWEVIPNSEWCMFQPYYRNVTTNKQFWGRRDEWTYVRTLRKVGSDELIEWSKYLGVFNVSGGGEQYPMPASRADIEISAFRLPYHQGANESKEHQKWLQKHEIQYAENYINAQGGDTITAVEEPGRIIEKGYVIAPSDFGLYKHIPHRLYNQGAMDTKVIEQFNAPGNIGLNNLLSGNQAGVSLYNYLVQVFSDPGDRILDPFCGNGAMGVAAIVNGRQFVGVEYNQDRARSAELALEEMSRILS